METQTNHPTIFDIGYQMRMIDQLIDELKRNKIDVLVDLREKPYSRKPGYGKNQIRANIEAAGIEYRWLGNVLGGFTCRDSWDCGLVVLKDYAKTKRICIMCLEHDNKECHRLELIEILTRDYNCESVSL